MPTRNISLYVVEDLNAGQRSADFDGATQRGAEKQFAELNRSDFATDRIAQRVTSDAILVANQ